MLYERSSIICLQEFWIGNEELVNLYDKRLGDAGYVNFKLERTNNRGDGLLIAVQKEYFTVVNYKELHFNDCGDRVAQLLHVELAFPFSQRQNSDITQEILIVNTHLLFPHDTSLSLVRLHQVYKILQYVESYQKEKQLKPLPIMLCGDWNGSKRGHVYKFLRSQGFVSSYDAAHHYTDADAHKVVQLILFSEFFIWMFYTVSCSGLATAIIGEIYVLLILYGFLILTNIKNYLKQVGVKQCLACSSIY